VLGGEKRRGKGGLTGGGFVARYEEHILHDIDQLHVGGDESQIPSSQKRTSSEDS